MTDELTERTDENAETAQSSADGSKTEGEPASTDPEEPFDVSVLDQLSNMQKDGADLPLRALKLFQKHAREAMLKLIDSPETKDHQKIAQSSPCAEIDELKHWRPKAGAHLQCHRIKRAKKGADT